jgi:hypothetical protein
MTIIRLTRDAILEDAPLGIHTPLAEVELPAGLTFAEVAGLIAGGDAGPAERQPTAEDAKE